MDVKNAIALMAKNPLVSFPWIGTLIGLINGFLPEGNQLDPNTAKAADVITAIDSLEPSIQEMVYASHIGVGPSTYTPPPAAAPRPQLTAAETNEAAIVATRNTMFKMFGIAIIAIAVYWTLNLGNGAEPKDVIEVLKMAISLMSDKAAVPPESP